MALAPPLVSQGFFSEGAVGVAAAPSPGTAGRYPSGARNQWNDAEGVASAFAEPQIPEGDPGQVPNFL